MDISGKIWGSTSSIFNKNNVQVCRITGIKGGRSSNHKHQSKLSMFFVERGSIRVVIEKQDYNLADATILGPGQSTIIKAGEYHYFEVIEDGTVCYEIYWTQLDDNDIMRKDVGLLTNPNSPTA